MKTISKAFILTVSSLVGVYEAADLNLTGQNGVTIENQTYDRLIISNSSNITVRNCSFSAVGTSGPVSISGSDKIVIENCDIDGKVDACNSVSIDNNSSYVTIKNCTIHDGADDGMSIWNASNLEIIGNTICHLYGCGTDNGCGPCYNGHSDGIELVNSDNVLIEGNLIFDVRSTGAIFMGGGDTYCHNVEFVNNIFYTPENAITVYIQNVDGVKFFNNIAWKGHWHGVAIGVCNDLEMKNNIIRSINFSHLGGSYDPNEHDISHNLITAAGEFTLGDNDVWSPLHRFANIPSVYVSTDYREVVAADFDPLGSSLGIDAGYAAAGIPETDFYGHPRVDIDSIDDTGTGTYAYWDIGPVEYGASVGLHDRFLTAEADAPRLMAYPNPITDRTVIIAGREYLRTPHTVSVYSSSNQLVNTLTVNNGNTVAWAGNDRTGNRLTAGVYLLVFEYKGEKISTSAVLMNQGR